MPLSAPVTLGGCRRIASRRAGGPRRGVSTRAAKTPEKASEGDKPAEKEATSLAVVDPEVNADNSIELSTYRDSVEQVKAIAAKISTARRLARKLAEEKAAVSAIKGGDTREAEIIRRKTELNSAEAAAAAARADALARSSKLKVTSSRSREAARLAAENKALLEVLTSVAEGNPSIQAKLQDIRQRYPVGSQMPAISASVDVPTGTVDAPSRTAAPPPPSVGSASPDSKAPMAPSTNGVGAAASKGVVDAPETLVDTPKVPETDGKDAEMASAETPEPPAAESATASAAVTTPEKRAPSTDAPAKDAATKPPAPAAAAPEKRAPVQEREVPAAVQSRAAESKTSSSDTEATASKPAAPSDEAPAEKAVEKVKEDEVEEQPAKENQIGQKAVPIVDAFKGVLGGLGSLGAVSGERKSKDKQKPVTPAPSAASKAAAETKAAAEEAESAKAEAEKKAEKEKAEKEKAEQAKAEKEKVEKEKAEAKRKGDAAAAAASKRKAENTAKKLVADRTAAAKAEEAKASAVAAQQPAAPSAASAAAAAAAEAAAEATAAVPKAAAAAKAAAAKAAEAPPAKPPIVAPEDSRDPTVTKQPAGAPNLPTKDSTTDAKAAAAAGAAPKEKPKPAAQKPPKPQVTAQSSTQDIVSALEATKARLSGRKPIDTVRKPKDDLLPDPEAVERLKAKAEQAAEASYKAKAPSVPPPKPPPSAQPAASTQRPAATIPGAIPAAKPAAKAAPKPQEVAPPVGTIISDMKRKGITVTTDLPARPGTSVRIFVDKSKTVFASDDNEHHMQLKIGLNNWEDIHVKAIAKVTEVPNVNDVYFGTLLLPQDLFAVDFVIQDYRTAKVDNNEGLDYKLKLVDAPTEEEILDRRAREFEAAERDRLTQIAQAEAEISKEIAAQREDAEGDAMHEWWRVRRGELRQHAIEMVQQEMGGGGEGCADSMDGVYAWLGGRPTPGKQTMLMYNRDASELRHKKDLVLHLGCNNWAGQKKELYQFTKAIQADLDAAGLRGGGGNWYSTKCMIPSNARIIDFVVSDKDLQVWDNNHHRDYHSRVNNGKDQATLEEEAYRQLLANSLDSDTEAAQRAAKKAGERVLLRAEAQRKRRALQRKVLYTNPLVPKAGQTCEVYYNPDMTVLSGRPEVHMRGSWNRWTHPQGIPTTKMEPAFTCGIGFMKAVVKVPEDAIVADFVFLDSANEQSGFYDNNNGLDYHVPVVGASGTLPPLRIAHVSVEMAPIAKVGGMGDVVTALGRAVQEYGHEVEVLMPKYDCLRYDLISNVTEIASFNFAGSHIRVFRGQVEGLNTTFLEPDNGMFWVGCVYGRNDDAHRFNFFCGAALEYLKHHAPHKTDVVHCHDWPTAPVAFGDVGGSRTVFTIHNLNYGADLIGRAMAETSVATTVSPTYAQEISGHPAVAANLGKMFGVRNGIDVDIWDPSSDHFLPVKYNVENFDEGKAAAKRQLRQRMNLSDTDVPVVGVVTRLTHQKGIHLIKHAAYRTLERGGQFVLLGSAPDPRVQADFESLAGDLQNQYNDRARLVFSFDEPLSHMIYAGCDLILVPSMFEPCGLTQMIGMRYGTVAVVRKTGGLADTVFDVDDDYDRAEAYGMEVNGFNFEGTDNGGLDYALNRSINMWYSDRAYFTEIAKRCMSLDWSWYGPAQDYVELYYRALKAM